MPAMTVMAFDYGRRNIGVAVGQTISRTAEPLAVVNNKKGQADWTALETIIDEWKPDEFVVGMPSTADGNKSDFHLEIERFAEKLETIFARPAHFCDERLSSYAAEHNPVNRRLATDAVAAQMILQTWFEHHAETEEIK